MTDHSHALDALLFSADLAAMQGAPLTLDEFDALLQAALDREDEVERGNGEVGL